MYILIADKLKDEHLQKIRETAVGDQVVAAARDEFMDYLPRAEVLVVWAQDFNEEVVRRGKNLRWVHALTAGVDSFLPHLSGREDIILTNSSGVHVVQVAEHALALIFALTRNLHFYVRRQAEGIWKPQRMDEVEGKTLGIIGMGRIGNALARKAHALGMKVVGVKNHPGAKPPYVEKLLGLAGIREAVSEADFVVLLLPLTDATRGLFDRSLLESMKASAYFINLARGEVVDEEALITMLAEKRIAGAGLDVFSQEPLPADSPFYRLENVLMTPHTGGFSPYYNTRATQIFCENLSAYKQGKPLPNQVDYQQGY